jgi:Glycosyltransferase family 87
MPRDVNVRHILYPGISLLLFWPVLRWGYWPTHGWTDVPGYQVGRDFINLWAAPQFAFGGRLSTLFDLPGYQTAVGVLLGHPVPFTTWSYPLYTLPLFWPLAQLPYFWALAIWTFGLFAVFAALVLSEIRPSQRTVALLALALAPACLINAVGGQCGVLSATLMIGGILLIDRRPALAGVLLGLLAFKPQMAIVIPFALLALGAWRVILVAALTVLALVALSVALFGLDSWRHYFDINAAYTVASVREFHDTFKYMLASVLAGARTFGLSNPVALAVQGVVAVATIVLACWAVRRTNDPCRRAFVLVTAAPLITPYVFNYDLVGVAAMLVWMLFGRLPWRSEWSGVCLLVWIAPTAMMYLNQMGLGVMPLALMALFVMGVRTMGRTPLEPLPAARNRLLAHPVAS